MVESTLNIKSEDVVDYQIFNPNGNMIRSDRTQGEISINLETLTSGTYMIRLSSGVKHRTVRFVKQ